jgi:flavorubredoxin
LEADMKALVVYESMFGNTKQVASAIADGMRPWVDVDVVDAADAPAPGSDITLIVAGGPTHAFSMSRARTRADAIQRGAQRSAGAAGLREWLGAQSSVAHQRIATFDTRLAKSRHFPGSAARAAARLAHRHGHETVASPHTFWVRDTKGPLLVGELDRAREWGRELAVSAGGAAPAGTHHQINDDGPE